MLFGISFCFALQISNGNMGSSSDPAWIICVEIFNKIKTELITEAMDTVKDAIDSKLIDVQGSLITLPDKPSDTELYIFIARKLVEERESIVERYKSYLESLPDSGITPEMVQQRERLHKFLLSVERIYLLMHYSGIVDVWMNEISMHVEIKEPTELIKATLEGNAERAELLGYVIKSQIFEREKVLAKDERALLESAIGK